MNTDPKKSAQPCGCDEGANHQCAACTRKVQRSIAAGEPYILKTASGGEILVENRKAQALWPTPEGLQVVIQKKDEATDIAFQEAPVGSRLFGTDAAGRKGFPVFTGGLMYFPDALAALAAVSKAGNDQHNPGQPLHWAREKSTDQMDTATRHMMDHGTGFTKDSDGKYHLAKAAWRILAELQLTIEKERA